VSPLRSSKSICSSEDGLCISYAKSRRIYNGPASLILPYICFLRASYRADSATLDPKAIRMWQIAHVCARQRLNIQSLCYFLPGSITRPKHQSGPMAMCCGVIKGPCAVVLSADICIYSSWEWSCAYDTLLFFTVNARPPNLFTPLTQKHYGRSSRINLAHVKSS
jgi:hypothetical protein